MSSEPSNILHHPGPDRALFWMVLLSAAVHLVGIVLLVLLPTRLQWRPARVTAYTVELVTSDQLAGTNLFPGDQKKKAQAPAPAVAPQAKPKPPPAPPLPKAEVVQKPPPPAEPKKKEPKPAAEKAVAIAAKSAPKSAQPTPTRVVQARAPSVAKRAPKSKAQTEPAPEISARERDARSRKPPTPSQAEIAARERDERIASAIKRVRQRGAGGGTGKAGGQSGGGSISVGPGQGVGGGVIKGVEYLLYYNLMKTRLKEAWAWADRTRQIEADAHFGISEEGEVFDVRISRSSGDAAFDASVLRAVRAVSPLPPPPEIHRKEFRDVEFTFNLSKME